MNPRLSRDQWAYELRSDRWVELITHPDSDEKARLVVCPYCYAVVDERFKVEHIDWHIENLRDVY